MIRFLEVMSRVTPMMPVRRWQLSGSNDAMLSTQMVSPPAVRTSDSQCSGNCSASDGSGELFAMNGEGTMILQ